MAKLHILVAYYHLAAQNSPFLHKKYTGEFPGKKVKKMDNYQKNDRTEQQD